MLTIARQHFFLPQGFGQYVFLIFIYTDVTSKPISNANCGQASISQHPPPPQITTRFVSMTNQSRLKVYDSKLQLETGKSWILKVSTYFLLTLLTSIGSPVVQ